MQTILMGVRVVYYTTKNGNGRVKATAGRHSLIRDRNDAMTLEENKIACAKALLNKLGWLKHSTVFFGYLPDETLAGVVVRKDDILEK